jgi:hypothetical protein
VKKLQIVEILGPKNRFWRCFTLYLSGKIFFTLILEAIVRKKIFPSAFLGKIRKKIAKNMEKVAKIWHRGNFRPKIVIFETGCGNFRPKRVIFETGCGNLP